MPEDKIFSLRLPMTDFLTFKTKCEGTGETMSEVLRALVDDYIQGKKTKVPAKPETNPLRQKMKDQILSDVKADKTQQAIDWVNRGIFDKHETLFEQMLSSINKEPTINLYHDDFRNVNIAEGSVDVVITDPPYSKKYLPLYKDLGIFSNKVLKEGGSLLFMCGKHHIYEVLDLMKDVGLNYHWMIAYIMPGAKSGQVWHKKINAFWKPIIWYTKGKYNRNWHGDVCKSQVNENDKRFHFWGQTESGMTDIVDRFSYPGDLVVDPFMGAGTTGIACKTLNRSFIGMEIDQDFYTAANLRLNHI